MAKSGESQIRRILRQLTSVAEQVIKRVAFDIQANLVRASTEGGTPVDTGWARANWLTNVGTPFLTPIGSYEQAKEGSVPAAGFGLGSIASYKLPFGKVFISNNVPYIVNLNEGSSKKAPAGFVQAAILRALVGLRSVVVVRA